MTALLMVLSMRVQDKISTSNLTRAPPSQAQAQAAMPNLYGNLNGINVEQLQQLMQHAQALSQTPYAGPSSQGQQGDPSQGWGPGNQDSEYDRGYHENGAGRGAGPGEPSRRWNEEAQGWGPERGGRGRGGGRGMRGAGRGRGDGYRSTKRKPCSFFQAGRRAHRFPIARLRAQKR